MTFFITEAKYQGKEINLPLHVLQCYKGLCYNFRKQILSKMTSLRPVSTKIFKLIPVTCINGYLLLTYSQKQILGDLILYLLVT